LISKQFKVFSSILFIATAQLKMSIRKISEIDFSKVTFSEPKTNPHGGKGAAVYYDGEELLIQTPRMRLPFGLSRYEEEDKVTKQKTGKVKYSIDFAFTGYKDDPANGVKADPEVKEFYDFLQKMDQRVLKEAHQKYFQWLESPDQPELGAVKFLLRPSVKFSKDKVTKQPSDKYPPNLSCEVPMWKTGLGTSFYLQGGSEIPQDQLQTNHKAAIPDRSDAKGILKAKVTFNGSKFGFKWVPIQAKVYPRSTVRAYAFRDDDDEEVEEHAAGGGGVQVAEPVRAPVNTVQDSEEENEDEPLDDDSEEVAPAPVPAPAPAPAKKPVKVVRKA
jgi:hypothetical protein